MNLIEELGGGIGHLFDANVAVALTDATQSTGQLWPTEEEAVKNAVPDRRAEYRAARHAARKALSDLGHAPAAIPSAPDRSPVWPAGIVGSISHCKQICIAALARAEHQRSIGVDIELDTALNPIDLDTVCTRLERSWLSEQPKPEQRRLAAVIFSAKESAYKAQYPISQQMFGFEVLHIIPDLAAGRFTSSFTQKVTGFQKGETLQGRFILIGGMVVSALTIPH